MMVEWFLLGCISLIGVYCAVDAFFHFERTAHQRPKAPYDTMKFPFLLRGSSTLAVLQLT